MWIVSPAHSIKRKSFIINWAEVGRCAVLFLLSVIVAYFPIFITSIFDHLGAKEFNLEVVFTDTLKANDFKYINISSLVIVFIEYVLILHTAKKSKATIFLDVVSFVWFLLIVVFWAFSVSNTKIHDITASIAPSVFIITMIICFIQIISKNIG